LSCPGRLAEYQENQWFKGYLLPILTDRPGNLGQSRCPGRPLFIDFTAAPRFPDFPCQLGISRPDWFAGCEFTPEELKTFNTKSLLGKSCRITIVQVQDKDQPIEIMRKNGLKFHPQARIPGKFPVISL